VRRRHDDDALRGIESVHLGQQLIERLLALVVPREESRRAGARLADRVELVDEHDARRLLLRLLEEIAHARGPDPDEHLDELGTREEEERHGRSARDRAGEEGLAGAGRADEQYSLRNSAAEALVFLRTLEKIHDLDELRLRLLDSRHVGERRL